jgi:hypothetical protein
MVVAEGDVFVQLSTITIFHPFNEMLHISIVSKRIILPQQSDDLFLANNQFCVRTTE